MLILFVKNGDEKVVTYNESDHKKYIIKNWFDGNECNVKSINELSASVAALAKLHTAFDKVSLNIEKKVLIAVKILLCSICAIPKS